MKWSKYFREDYLIAFFISIIMIIVVAIFLSDWYSSPSEDQGVNVDIPSLFENIPSAIEIAQDWSNDAYLVTVKAKYYEFGGEVRENFIQFNFESSIIESERLEVICLSEGCDYKLKTNSITALELGLVPLNLSEIKVDSPEALQIASSYIDIDMDGLQSSIDATLGWSMREEIWTWSIVNNSLYSNGSGHHSAAQINPMTGEMVFIYD